MLTLNIPEDETFLIGLEILPITIIRNRVKKGFGANHNAAFWAVSCTEFVIVNPDIRIGESVFHCLLQAVQVDRVGACAPVVMSRLGEVEDSARVFPNLGNLLKRRLFRDVRLDYQWTDSLLCVDWVAGMFVMYRSEAFRAVGGFDERFYMYLEDADLCRRMKRAGWTTVLQPAAEVVHDAQRASRRSLRHFLWHVSSAFRFLLGR